MKQFWIAGAVAAAVLLAAWHPASHGAVMTVASSDPLPRAHLRRGAATRGSPIVVVYVAGAVTHAGLYRLPDGARADDAVRKAGGFAPGADQAGINLAQRLNDGDEVRVFRIGERTPRPGAGPRRQPRKKGGARPAPGTLNVNTADEKSLAQLPGIGPGLAQRIVAFRDLNGDFQSLDELLDVAGMSRRHLDVLWPYLSVHDGP